MYSDQSEPFLLIIESTYIKVYLVVYLATIGLHHTPRMSLRSKVLLVELLDKADSLYSLRSNRLRIVLY